MIQKTRDPGPGYLDRGAGLPGPRGRAPGPRGLAPGPRGCDLGRGAGHLNRGAGHLDRRAGHLDRDGDWAPSNSNFRLFNTPASQPAKQTAGQPDNQPPAPTIAGSRIRAKFSTRATGCFIPTTPDPRKLREIQASQPAILPLD